MSQHVPAPLRRIPPGHGRGEAGMIRPARGHGAGRRARRKAAPDHRHSAETAGAHRRPRLARPCHRPAGSGPASSGSSSMSIIWAISSPSIWRSAARPRSSSRARRRRWRPAAASSTPWRCSATSRSSWSMATASGLDGIRPALIRLADAWARRRPTPCCCCSGPRPAVGYGEGLGDYIARQLDRPRRRQAREVAPYLFAGVQLLAPSLFQGHAGRRVLAEPDLRQGRGDRAGSARWCMTANGTMSARPTG